MRNLYKTKILEKAKALHTMGDLDSLVYCALELRQCIESIVYEKLKGYKDLVPGIVFNKWQPPHAMKTLLYFEPDAEDSYKIAIAVESSPGVTIGPFHSLGEHKVLGVKWLNKNYNKLGSLLHVQNTNFKKQKPVEDIKNYLFGVIEKLEEIVEISIFSIAMAERIKFRCKACDKNTLANVDSIKNTHRALCINPNCGASHLVDKTENGWRIKLEATKFKCTICNTENFIPNTDLHIGMTFKCLKCKEKHIIIGHSWQYITFDEYNKKKEIS